MVQRLCAVVSYDPIVRVMGSMTVGFYFGLWVVGHSPTIVGRGLMIRWSWVVEAAMVR